MSSRRIIIAHHRPGDVTSIHRKARAYPAAPRIRTFSSRRQQPPAVAIARSSSLSRCARTGSCLRAAPRFAARTLSSTTARTNTVLPPPPASSSCVIPQLDIRQWYADPAAFSESLRRACHLTGFFTLKHDIPLNLVDDLFHESDAFFSLPLEQKLKISYDDSPAFRGYMALGTENTDGAVDCREQLEIASEKAHDSDDPESYEGRLRGLNQWPDDNDGRLKDGVTSFVEHASRVSHELTKALGTALDLTSDAFLPLFAGDPFWQLKLSSVRLPSRGDDGGASVLEDDRMSRMGVGAHTDTGFLTLLLQDESGGLQVCTDGENWTDVPFRGNGTFVCNIGEVAEIATGGYFRATPHRVVIPLSLLRSGASGVVTRRLSVPFFYNPRLEARVEVLELPDTLVWDRDETAMMKERRWKRQGNEMLRVYGRNAFKSLARSHPRVFERWHGDLMLDEGGQLKKREG
eukprot:CAMPEP_0172498552 /NCGR_PEP_ID=MMETSP1066-20121228/113590_1 /TAXON_ID=671091 /ORGANISM="Coscinodiscus wailesii, Strain CCMP2513" /LENGTH=461 /DNA_ID=CAMNT_0013271857 /DNA_START=34 /DNA_END=1419 /DNA_ORIENTATION=-